MTQRKSEQAAMDAKTMSSIEDVVKEPVSYKATGTPKSAYQRYVYIGPSLPNGMLKTNTLLCGRMEEILEHLKLVLDAYPQVRQLLMPVSRLADTKAKVQNNGNILHKYYQDIVSTMEGRK